MSATTSRSRTSTVVGILVGLVLLGLVAAFAIGLPKAAGDDATEAAADVELSLPDTLPGGYAAADDAASFADGDLAQQAEAIAQQQAASTKYGNQVLPDVLGTPAVTRSYVVDGTTAVFVQVFQSDGGAFAPGSLTDPETTNGAGGTTMEAVGDGACILTYGQSTDGSAGTPSQSECQVSQDGLTVQIQSSGVEAAELVKVADGILDDLSQQ
ncbi:MAG: hypothetical protein H6529_15510 [Nocardioides sp.]|nr:hypothetical protein [Nocardioidaceae bacterium]MCB8957872.1 hypothetical protein [Nocardioides sp.]